MQSDAETDADSYLQIVGFLNAMARDVDFANIKPPEEQKQGPHGGHDTSFVFEPMRRKLHVVGSEQ